MFSLQPPRHISTLHETAVLRVPANVCFWWKSGRAADITAMTDFEPEGDIGVSSLGYATFTFQKSGAPNLSTSRTLLRKAVG